MLGRENKIQTDIHNINGPTLISLVNRETHQFNPHCIKRVPA